MWAIGATDLLVGVDQYSQFPPQVRSLPKVGQFLSPNQDVILALSPDIVLLGAVQGKIASRLEDAGITVIQLRMHTLGDVRTAFVEIGRALGRKQAGERALIRFDRALDDARARAKRASGQPPRVLWVVDRQVGGLGNLVAAGPGTYVHELLEIAGGDNALQGAAARYLKLSVEQVIAHAPDIIIDTTHTDQPEVARKDWMQLRSVPAVQTRRVHVLGDPRFEAPGPRLADALSTLSDLLHDQ